MDLRDTSSVYISSDSDILRKKNIEESPNKLQINAQNKCKIKEIGIVESVQPMFIPRTMNPMPNGSRHQIQFNFLYISHLGRCHSTNNNLIYNRSVLLKKMEGMGRDLCYHFFYLKK